MNKIILRNLFRNVNIDNLNDTQKVLTFYKLAIELERMKEPDIDSYFEYPVNFKNERVMLIDFPCNDGFYKLFEKNRNAMETKFPSDLYIGMKIQIEDVSYRLLNMVIDYNDIKTINIKEEVLPVVLSGFEVNLKEASRLELLPEKVDNINNGIKANPTLSGILEVLKQEIAEEVSITESLYLALSSKSIELSQIYSELNSKYLEREATSAFMAGGGTKSEQGSLMKSFLLNESINNSIDSIDADNLICVTQLDESQKIAIAEALNSRISVITGAPGTGKTQVIENLLANAMILGKKVLVASKNNKAVDNVKDRFDTIDSTGYFLRFGSKQVVATSTLPSIDRISNEIGDLSDNTDSFNECKGRYEASVQSIQQGKKHLAIIRSLQQELQGLAKSKEAAQKTIDQLVEGHRIKIEGIERCYDEMLPLNDNSLDELNSCLSTINTLNNTYTAKFSGFWAFWHRIFSVKKYAAVFLNEVEKFPLALKGYMENNKYGFCTNISEFSSDEILLSQIKKWQGLITKGISFKQALANENIMFNNLKSNADKNLSQLISDEQEKANKLASLNSTLPAIQFEQEKGKKWILVNSRKILSEYIHYQKKTEGAVKAISNYKSYVPDQIPWKDEEYSQFIRKTRTFLNIFRLCSVTSLSTKNAFPLASDLFDMVIIDEASQCDVASALPLIKRTKQLIVIGDPMQLRHISAVKVEEEQMIKKILGLDNSPHVKYAECSLYDYCKDLINNAKKGQNLPYMLRYHYRCYPSIIEYSNDMFYEGIMGSRLEIRTNVDELKGNPQGIVLVNVKGKQLRDNKNVNESEAKKSVEIAVRTAQTNTEVSIGIVTPFRHQAEYINRLIPTVYANRIEANTVHKYQGDEKDIMIYSLVVTTNSPEKKINWIDNMVPNLVNVAVTRAKSTLYVVGNIDYIKSHSNENKPLGYLVRYNN